MQLSQLKKTGELVELESTKIVPLDYNFPKVSDYECSSVVPFHCKPPKPIPDKHWNFLSKNWDLIKSKSANVENYSKRLDIISSEKSFPTREYISDLIMKSKINGISFDFKCDCIYQPPSTFSHQLEHFDPRFGYLTNKLIFHIPKFFDILKTTTIDIKLKRNQSAISSVLLDGTILSKSNHHGSVTMKINVCKNQAFYGLLMIDIKIFSHLPIYQPIDATCTINCIVFKQKWIQKFFKREFDPIVPEVSILKELKRIVCDNNFPDFFGGWPYMMPYTIDLSKGTLVTFKPHLKNKIVERDIDEIEFVFPSGTIIKI